MLEEIHQLLISFSCFGSTEVDLFFLHLAKAPCVSSHFLYWVEKVLLNRKEGINGGSLCVFLHARIMALLAWLPNVWILALYTDVPVGKLQLMMDHILRCSCKVPLLSTIVAFLIWLSILYEVGRVKKSPCDAVLRLHPRSLWGITSYPLSLLVMIGAWSQMHSFQSALNVFWYFVMKITLVFTSKLSIQMPCHIYSEQKLNFFMTSTTHVSWPHTHELV